MSTALQGQTQYLAINSASSAPILSYCPPKQRSETDKFNTILNDPLIEPERMQDDPTVFARGYEHIRGKHGDDAALAIGTLIASGAKRSTLFESAKNIDILTSAVALRMKRSFALGKHNIMNLLFSSLSSIKDDRYTVSWVGLTDALRSFTNGSRGETVGNCLDLTIIDNIVLSRFGYFPFAATNEEYTYGEIHHVHTRIRLSGSTYDLDNIYKNSALVRANPKEKSVSGLGLIGMVFAKKGKEAELSGDLTSAIKYYDRSIALFPNYISAYESRAYVKIMLGNYDGAIADVTSALSINPQRYTSFNSRAVAKYYKALELIDDGKLAAGRDLIINALIDIEGALRIEPGFALAQENKNIMEEAVK